MEILPILELKNNTIKVVGKIRRDLAHQNEPVPHATAIIIPVTVDKEILLMDKFKKKSRKMMTQSNSRYEKCTLFECFGGHLSYFDLSSEELEEGLTTDTYAKCALRELEEELLRIDFTGNIVPINYSLKNLRLLGFYPYKNDHNFEYTYAFLYFLEENFNFIARDTLFENGDLLEINLPVYQMTLDRAISSFKTEDKNTKFSDGIGRILLAEQKDKFIKIKNLINSFNNI